MTTTIRLPGGGKLGLYEPHLQAIDLPALRRSDSIRQPLRRGCGAPSLRGTPLAVGLVAQGAIKERPLQRVQTRQ